MACALNSSNETVQKIRIIEVVKMTDIYDGDYEISNEDLYGNGPCTYKFWL